MAVTGAVDIMVVITVVVIMVGTVTVWAGAVVGVTQGIMEDIGPTTDIQDTRGITDIQDTQDTQVDIIRHIRDMRAITDIQDMRAITDIQTTAEDTISLLILPNT